MSRLFVRRIDGLNGKRFATLINLLVHQAANEMKAWPELAVVE